MRRRRSQKKPEIIDMPKVRANEEIDAKQVRLLLADGSQHGVVSLSEAMQFARKEDLDLVEISAKAEFPVCKLMDYSKYLFDTKKKKIQIKKNQKQADQKTIKFRPNTNDGDYQIKMRKIHEFLDKGSRIKIVVWFRGREIAHQELGQEMLDRIKADLVEQIRIDDEPKLEGRQMIMAISPLSNRKVNNRQSNSSHA